MILIKSDTYLPLTNNKRLLTTCLKNQKIHRKCLDKLQNWQLVEIKFTAAQGAELPTRLLLALFFRVLRSLCYCNVVSYQYHGSLF